MTIPHGQVGKAYRATFIAILAIIAAAILLSCAYAELTGNGYAGVMPESALSFPTKSLN